MKHIIFTLTLLFSMNLFATVRQFDFSGNYQYEGDGVSDVRDMNYVLFPSNLRNDTQIGYDNYIQPPQPWYAKIPKNTPIEIKDDGEVLEIKHTSLFGTYVPSQIGEEIITKVDLRALGSERVTVDNENQSITYKRKAGNLFAGMRSEVVLTRLPNGDIHVLEKYKGWAPFPSPLPIHTQTEYFLRR